MIKWPRGERKDGLRQVVMYSYLHTLLDWFWSSWLKSLPANAGDIRDAGSVPGLGRFPREGYHSPLQYSCLEDPMDQGPWRATVHRVVKSWTRLKQLITLRTLEYISIIKISLHFPYLYCLSLVLDLWPFPCLSGDYWLWSSAPWNFIYRNLGSEF